MEDDIVGWYEFKKYELRRLIDIMDSTEEKVEIFRQQMKENEKRGYKLREMDQAFFDQLDAIHNVIRLQTIWINALREGLIEIEDKLNKTE